ncbi:MAG: hypothetical protein BMS9Abin10_0670 [Gammaproteobacteria bacterium]|nr:MAG: hypothetical protein BMS9Abin10_0670 [Gammaproteobacteria bacterium]
MKGNVSRAAAFVMLLLLLLTLPLPTAAAPVIMILEHMQAGERVQTPIEVIPDLVTSPYAGKGQLKWAILPGEPIDSQARPADRVVHLLRQIGLQRNLLATVKVRYFKAKQDGPWVPHFQLNQEALVARVNGRWRPLTSVRGVATLIVLTSSTLPNAEGYYPSLEFGLTTGLTNIDAWLVR